MQRARLRDTEPSSKPLCIFCHIRAPHRISEHFTLLLPPISNAETTGNSVNSLKSLANFQHLYAAIQIIGCKMGITLCHLQCLVTKPHLHTANINTAANQT